MKNSIILLSLGLCLAGACANAGGVVERACRESERTAASDRLCSCIQNVAQKTLSFSERRKVAKWFRDPHRAQETRQSDRARDEVLWKNYKKFGDTARRTCG
ncbi:hypothetical protein [Chachezhania antarctica]|uniref:hypothetical protein n=1 Tax=Chachezhania antarctica TaxID=2340860 RepID=UPI000EB2D5E2|nr:hypothetical protein [Chachezhania antarctica]|tara:strand:+ start:3447 stop:3752 length:306 start_codon:yes stop_codon:yes gene_type:complete